MLVKQTLTICLLFAVCLLHAQSNYKEGDVVTNHGTILHGFINYKEWHRNPDHIQFRPETKGANTQTLTADSVKGFTINGYVTYARYVLSISMDEISFENLKEVIDTATVTKAVFLKQIADGDRLALYSYTDEIKVRFFILDKRQATPAELAYRKILRNGHEITQPLFQQQLTQLAEDYNALSPGLKERIAKAGYSASAIKKIISNVNSKNEPGETPSFGKKRKLGFFVGAGATMSTVKYTGETLLLSDGLDNMGRFKFKSKVVTHSYLPNISAGADFYINPDIRRLIIRTELSAANIESTVKSYYRFNQYTPEEENTYTYSSWNIGFSPQTILNLYNSNTFRCYAGAGFILNYFINTKNKLERRDKETGELIATNSEYLVLKNFEMNAALRSGIRIKDHFDISLLWINPTEYTNYKKGKQSIKTSLLSLCILYNLKQ